MGDTDTAVLQICLSVVGSVMVEIDGFDFFAFGLRGDLDLGIDRTNYVYSKSWLRIMSNLQPSSVSTC